jgi:ubiquinone/menaquinone biosynthesis C-methylase UbiE
VKFKNYIAKQFGNPSGIVGRICAFIMNRSNGLQYKAVQKRVTGFSASKILDIGFGNGYLLKRLTKKSDNAFFGIDISEDMLAAAAKRNKRSVKAGKTELKIGRAEELPFADGFFDAVYTVNTVYFWSDLRSGLGQIYRALKSGGIFINAVYTEKWLGKLGFTKYGFSKYAAAELTAAAALCGFTSEIVTIKAGKCYYVISTKP